MFCLRVDRTVVPSAANVTSNELLITSCSGKMLSDNNVEEPSAIDTLSLPPKPGQF